MTFAECLLAFVGLIGLLAGLPMIGRFILGPINDAAGALNFPLRFQLSDFFWLLILLQVSLAFAAQFVGVDSEAFWLVTIFLLFAVAGLWGGSISFLSRSGITNIAPRACFTMLSMPGALGLMIAIPIFLVLSGLALVHFALGSVPFWADYNVSPTERAKWWTGWLILCCGVAGALRNISWWIARAMLSKTVPTKN